MSEESGSLNTTAAVGEKINAISDGSQIISAGRAISALVSEYVQESYCYRWLTKEPDPDVIVIDLRETYAFGPFITLLDQLVPHIEDAWQHSRVGAAAERVFKRLVEDVFAPLSETRGYELAAAMLAPPEPPERRNATVDDSESTEDELS
ncbi:hypothetical protein SAMN05443574_1125 [Haloarcula vallismortis]|uniref:Uncharacterized protein n=2 Tax=Haloarcula vallismortis TaxID=28442 RepID=M0IXA5_HALVA|nr:hypothetical protein [Haloarcula vallismortis]EMA01366.1 hypothetical protein C437_16746 [Haloarcula vallismortis ATCC 29715]SDX01710.1 hypothetical protein SAMN05443574_1125 [Haloarcula vallismortis]